MKKLLAGVCIATAALASTQLLADPGGHRHGANAAACGANCPAAADSATPRGGHGMGHGMRGRMHAMAGHDNAPRRGQSAGRGHGGEGCPMQSERKPG